MFNNINSKFSKVVDNYHKVVKPTLLKTEGIQGINNWFCRIAESYLRSKGKDLYANDSSYVQAYAKTLAKKFNENLVFSGEPLAYVSI